MSRSHRRTLGQRLGLLTGFGLILGGVLGWAWSLFQSPGQAAAPPIATPQPPELSTPTTPPGSDLAGGAVEVTVEQGERAVVEHETLDPTSSAEDVEPEDVEPEDVEPADVEVAEVEVPPATTTPRAVPSPAAPVTAPATPAAPAAVPDAVKAIRAAAAAARERLETPARALPDAAPVADSADTAE